MCLVISADCTTNCLQVEVKIKVELHDSGSFTKNFPSVPQENWAWVSSFHCFLFLGLPRILPCNSWYWAKYTVHTPTVALLCLQSSQDFSTYEIWKMSGELREDIIWSCPFSQVAHNMYFSICLWAARSKAQKTHYDHSLAVNYLDYHSWHKSAQPDIAESMHWGDHMRRCCVMSRKMGGIKCKLQSGLGFLS